MAVNKRSEVKIYFEVLDLFYQEETATGEAHLTTVARRAKVPNYRFQKITSKLVENHLVIKTSTGVQVTANGLCCLQKMRHANQFFREIGLSI